MSAPNPLHTQRLTQQSGLTLSLRHEPRLKQCAAFLRVHAGSHDAPTAWPGLAHCLEHLVCLGTQRFPAADNLMAYVKRHGGQVNTRTQARHTDFVFEVPTAAFEGALERLCDMLAHPRMSPDEQMRECERLHAESIAQTSEPSIERQLSVLLALNPAHPLRALRAHHQHSSASPRPAVEQALRDFYHAFYHAGNISLSMAGPLPNEALRALAERYTEYFAMGQSQVQNSPPTLMLNRESRYQQLDAQHLDLVFAFEQLPNASRTALDVVCHWLNADIPGGLLAHLREHCLCDTLKATTLYPFEGQALLHVEFGAPQHLAKNTPQICDTFYDWLGFFSDHHLALHTQFWLQQQREQDAWGALEFARHDIEPRTPELPEQSVKALKDVLHQMQPATPPAAQHTWQLPTHNPLLDTPKTPAGTGLIRGQTSAHRGLRTFAQDRARSRRDLPQ